MTSPLLASRRHASASTLTALMVVSALIAPAATAAEDAGPPALAAGVVADALANVERIDPTLVHDAVAEGSGLGSQASGSVIVPSDPALGVRISDGARTVIVDLPDAASAAPAVTLADGGVVYPAPHSATSVLVAMVVGAAWAIDADGDRMPTQYSVSGSTLTQTVDHTAPGVAYPVVADPAWLAPLVLKCLVGLGLNGAQIGLAATSGLPGSIGAALAKSIAACLTGK